MLKPQLLKLLNSLSRSILKKYHPDIIGITGSVGKTSTKEAVAHVLGGTLSVRASSKNYNNEVGVPLTIIGVTNAPNRSLVKWLGVFLKALGLIIFKAKDYPAILVLEMGADRPGDIAYLTAMAPCRIGVLTAVSHAHTEFFKDLAGVAKEKRGIVSHLASSGFAILNHDNELAAASAASTKACVITYGFKAGADWQASDVTLSENPRSGWVDGLQCKVNRAGSIVPVFIPGVISDSYVYSMLVSLIIADIYGINIITAAERLRSLPLVPGRMRLIPGIKHTLLIDDTYNSSPEAVKAALATLARVAPQKQGRRYAVLGDMLELGPDTEQLHRAMGFAVAEQGIDFLITVGEASKHTAQAAMEAGIPENNIARFAQSQEAGKFLQEKLVEGDAVLVKGSQGMRMEKIVKEVMDEPINAAKMLVRQSAEWVG